MSLGLFEPVACLGGKIYSHAQEARAGVGTRSPRRPGNVQDLLPRSELSPQRDGSSAEDLGQKSLCSLTHPSSFFRVFLVKLELPASWVPG